MNLPVLITLFALAAVFMVIERLGVPTTLSLNFKGDVKRETRWLAQYGQAICTIIVALLVWRLDPAPAHRQAPWAVVTAVFGTSIITTLIKRLLGRVRPGREDAGAFLGPTWRHANHRESFPSSHSACAVALTVVLAALYPPAREIFWALAFCCAALRYIMDAHWPSDVFGGIAFGYAIPYLVMPCFLK